jgi:Tol biopolymer transport system component
MHLRPGTRTRTAVLLVACAILAGCATSTGPSPSSVAVSAGEPSVAVVTSAAPPAAPPPSSPAITGLTGRVLFTRAGGTYGDETVFVANVDGTDQQQLSDLNAGCCPWASRDGSRIVFTTGARDGRATAVTEGFDGSGRVVLPLPKGTLNLAAGPISPDGSLVVREGFDDANPAVAAIYVTRLSDGSGLRRLTQMHFIPGDFSPDGKQIVLFQGPEGSPPPPGSLWIVNLDGTGLRQLSPKSTQVGCCFNYRWSPDGSKILFADEQGVLWTIAPDGSHLTLAFKDRDGRYAITPTWSPDGSAVLFALDPTPNPFDHPANGLYVTRADGSGLTEIIATNDFKREPDWVSP